MSLLLLDNKLYKVGTDLAIPGTDKTYYNCRFCQYECLSFTKIELHDCKGKRKAMRKKK